MNEKKQLVIYQGDVWDSQSIRTTFRFSEEALEALTWLSQRYRVPIKEVLHSALDQLINQEDLSLDFENGEQDDLSTNLKIGAILARPKNGKNIKKVFKKTIKRTVVVMQKTISNLSSLTMKYKISRDELINEAIITSKNITCQYDELILENCEEAFKLINNFILESQVIQNKLKVILGENDQIIEDMNSVVTMIININNKIKDEIKNRQIKLS